MRVDSGMTGTTTSVSPISGSATASGTPGSGTGKSSRGPLDAEASAIGVIDWPEAVACPSAVNRRIHARPCRSSRGAKPASPLIDSTVAWSCGCCSIRTPAPAAAASAATSCFEGASKTHHNVPPRRKTAAATGRSHVKRSDASRLSRLYRGRARF